MPAGILNLNIDQGANFDQTMTLFETQTEVMNLSGFKIRAEIRKHFASSSFVPFTLEVPNPLDGKVILRLTSTQTSALEPGVYLYDMETEDQSGSVSRVLQGRVIVSAQVTKDSLGITVPL